MASDKDRAIRVGLVGCGGRGTGAIRDILTAATHVEVVALGDVSHLQIERSLQSIQEYRGRDKTPLQGLRVEPDKRFSGLDAYRQVIDSGIDIVMLATPPGFRPEHFAYAVEAGVHIFCEKPCATDPVGVRRILALDGAVAHKGLSVVAGFQRRHTFGMQEMVRRIHSGAIGDLLSGRVYYNATGTPLKERPEGISDRDWLYLNWYRVDWLSGDHIVEQAVHNIDLMVWVMGGPPVTAYGMGGVQYHHDLPGNIYDHFTVEYTWENGTRVTMMSRQIPHTDGTRGGIFFGTKGTADFMNSALQITGPHEDHWEGQWARLGRTQEHATLVRSIRHNQPINMTRIICETTMTAIQGREAAYSGKVVTWDDMMQSELRLAPADIAAWDGSIRPTPKPGVARG